jgi:SAM-dependent methyltransferase
MAMKRISNLFTKKNIKFIEDEDWLRMLIKSIDTSIVEGIEFPSFPNDDIQSQFVGSSNENALREGFEFYKLVKGYTQSLGKPFNQETYKFLDFGCGWGRYLRFFSKDVSSQNLFGVDIDPDILEVCRNSKINAQLARIFPDGKLPYPDSFFDCVIAYSVFTHLPENIHNHWINEIARVSKPGCVFVLTLESIRFLDFIESIDTKNPPSGWHAGLSQFSERVSSYREEYKSGKFVYLPTGGGDFRAADVYGDAVVSLKYIEKNWGNLFNIIDFIDDSNRFWQAVLVAQRP